MYSKFFILFIIIFLISCSKNDTTYNIYYNFSVTPDTLFYETSIKSITKKGSKIDSLNYSFILKQTILQRYSDKSANIRIEVDSFLVNEKNFPLEKSSHNIKITAFGEILSINTETVESRKVYTDIDIERVLLKFYPLLPYKPVKIGETWERHQMISYEDKENWGDININRFFRLEGVENNNVELRSRISGESMLHNKLVEQKELRTNVVINSDQEIHIDIENSFISKMKILTTTEKSKTNYQEISDQYISFTILD